MNENRSCNFYKDICKRIKKVLYRVNQSEMLVEIKNQKKIFCSTFSGMTLEVHKTQQKYYLPLRLTNKL